ncbi:hypothetical protein ES332_D12G188900v1 [Gossypium tomentosum]|uniref:Uncharacterized protein n=1 Tax=Gossypium tomentosum TaxID=34277 RepID=A0A5D2ICG7_GOSTO|nr:hypothetical protein ES332_D12G188900v1 [Gossypium tomentosum]
MKHQFSSESAPPSQTRYKVVSQLAYGATHAGKAAAARVFPSFLLLEMFSFWAILGD